jgi:hypothetical protein
MNAFDQLDVLIRPGVASDEGEADMHSSCRPQDATWLHDEIRVTCSYLQMKVRVPDVAQYDGNCS